MTLNLTVVTRRCIYQSADYRMTNTDTGSVVDFETQKIVLVHTFRWNATVCFAGVGRTHGLNVGEWLAERTRLIQSDDPFERLLEEILKANNWLSAVPPPHNRHSFSVGAFVGSELVFALISNFEQPFAPQSAIASPNLSVFKMRLTQPTIFVSGQKQAVSRPERRQLVRLAERNPEPSRMYSALAALNRKAAMHSTSVSPACFTTHVSLTGESGGFAHDIGDQPLVPMFAIPAMQEALTELLDRNLGPGKYHLRQCATSRSEPTDEFHRIQIREKPDNTSVHSNYGAFLNDIKGDMEGAEREFRIALELDGNHVNALGNLANLLWKKGNRDQAASLYRKALETDPGNENVTLCYARFLLHEIGDRQATRVVLDQGITAHSKSSRLHLFRAELSLLDNSASEALEDYRRAREIGENQAEVEAGYACALHMSGEPVDECIAAYRVAIAFNPDNGSLKLNLAQLLFIKGYDTEANKRLQEAMRSQLDEAAQLEAQFYLLAHTSSDPEVIIRTTKSLLAQGARLLWNVSMNTETIRRRDPQKADLLEIVSEVMAGERDQAFLDMLLQGDRKS